MPSCVEISVLFGLLNFVRPSFWESLKFILFITFIYYCGTRKQRIIEKQYHVKLYMV